MQKRKVILLMKPYSLDLRQKIVDAYTNGENSFRQLAARFKVSLSMIQRLLKKFCEAGTLEPLKIGGGPRSQLDSHPNRILGYLEECNDLTLEQLCERLDKDTQVRVSISTMCRFLRKNHLTRKRKTTRSPQAELEKVQLQRVEYRQQIASFDFKDLVFLDETGIQLGITQKYARSQQGARA